MNRKRIFDIIGWLMWLGLFIMMIYTHYNCVSDCIYQIEQLCPNLMDVPNLTALKNNFTFINITS